MTFWTDDYTVLFKKENLQWRIHDSMTRDEKLNTISRIVIVMTIGGFIFTRSVKIIGVGIATLAAIVMYEKSKDKEYFSQKNSKVTEPTEKNPLMNVLLPEINGNPKRAAAKKYDVDTEEKIMKSVKEIIHDPRIYTGTNNEMDLEYSMRNFYTTANTTIPNDQKGFGDFCYGNMFSNKDGVYK